MHLSTRINSSQWSKELPEWQNLLVWTSWKVTSIRDTKGKVLVSEPEWKNRPSFEPLTVPKVFPRNLAAESPFSSSAGRNIVPSRPLIWWSLGSQTFPSPFFSAGQRKKGWGKRFQFPPVSKLFSYKMYLIIKDFSFFNTNAHIKSKKKNRDIYWHTLETTVSGAGLGVERMDSRSNWRMASHLFQVSCGHLSGRGGQTRRGKGTATVWWQSYWQIVIIRPLCR